MFQVENRNLKRQVELLSKAEKMNWENGCNLWLKQIEFLDVHIGYFW